jgi:hypothetical protein
MHHPGLTIYQTFSSNFTSSIVAEIIFYSAEGYRLRVSSSHYI